MTYAREFFGRVFGNPALDAVGAVLVIVGAVLGVAGMALASWLSGVAVVIVLLYASFRAFADVAEERDALSGSRDSQEKLVTLLANGRVKAESYLNELREVIALGDYDATFEPIESWWLDLLDRVSELSSVTAAQLGSKTDLEPARRPASAIHGNMNLAPLRSFLTERVQRISVALNAAGR
jgi:hypothetical protein